MGRLDSPAILAGNSVAQPQRLPATLPVTLKSL